MADPLIHIGSRTFELPQGADQQELATAITTAMDAKTTLTVQVVVRTATVTIYVNTSVVDFIALDWDGGGLGFFHG